MPLRHSISYDAIFFVALLATARSARTSNDADCDATEYGAVWEYLFKDANGTPFRLHVAFNNDGKVSLVARIPQGGRSVVLAYAADKEHQH